MSVAEAREAFFQRNPWESLLVNPHLTSDEDGPTGVAMAIAEEVADELAKRLCLDLMGCSNGDETMAVYQAWVEFTDGDLPQVMAILMTALASYLLETTTPPVRTRCQAESEKRWAQDIPERFKVADE